MGNCLVTKLKGVVDNPSLPKFGNLNIPVTATARQDAGGAYIIQNAKACQIIAKGGYVGYYKEDLLNHRTSLDIAAGVETSFWVSNGSYNIEITEKYSLLKLAIQGAGAECMGPINAAEFKYCTNLVNFGVAGASVDEVKNLGGPITGKLSDLNLLTKVVNLNINSAITIKGTPSDIAGMAGTLVELNLGSCWSVTGNIAELGPFIHLTTIDLYATQISGTFESFVQAQCESGRTSCESIFSAGFLRHGITFGTCQGDNSYYQYLSWESASKMCIYVGGSSGIPATTKVYVMGYTDGEIATKTASGGIWEGKEVVKVDA